MASGMLLLLLQYSTNMLVCGEDLGMIPSCVPGVMNELGIMSLKVQRYVPDHGHKHMYPDYTCVCLHHVVAIGVVKPAVRSAVA